MGSWTHLNHLLYWTQRNNVKRPTVENTTLLGTDPFTERDLQTRRKGDKDEVTIALKLRRETTMTYQWIAQRLVMGRFGHVSNLLAARRAKR